MGGWEEGGGYHWGSMEIRGEWGPLPQTWPPSHPGEGNQDWWGAAQPGLMQLGVWTGCSGHGFTLGHRHPREWPAVHPRHQWRLPVPRDKTLSLLWEEKASRVWGALPRKQVLGPWGVVAE